MANAAKTTKLTKAQITSLRDLIAGKKFYMYAGTERNLLAHGLIVAQTAETWINGFGWSFRYVPSIDAKKVLEALGIVF